MRPFRENDTYTAFRNNIENTVTEIRALDNTYVLKASPTELEQYYVNKIHVNPLELHVEHWRIEDPEGVNVDVTGDFNRAIFPGERGTVRGTRLTVVIPFDGDPLLWRLQASTYGISGYPDIEIRQSTIAFRIEFPDDTANSDEIRQRIDRETESLINAVGHLKNDVDQHNRTAPDRIGQALEKKRKQAEATYQCAFQSRHPD